MDENEEKSALSLQEVPHVLERRCDSDGNRYARQPIRAVVEFFEDNSSEDAVSAVTANLSGSGLFALMETPLPPGKVVTFRISLRRTVIAGLAEVVWVREEDEAEHLPKGVGVEFLAVRDRDRLCKALEAFGRRLPE